MENYRTSSESISTFLIGLTIVVKYVGQQEDERKGDQYCTDTSETIVYFRARQRHSGRNFIDLSLQDNVVIQRGFFPHIYHVGCASNLHSIINNGLTLGGQNSSKRQTVFKKTFLIQGTKSTRILNILT